MKIKVYERRLQQYEHQHRDGGKHDARQIFKAQRLANTFFVVFAEKLRRKYSRARHRAENTQIEYKKQLIYYGNARHLLGAHLPHHYVVQKTYKIGNSVLQHNGQRHRQHHRIKLFVAYKFF